MTPIQQQFEILKSEFPSVEMRMLSNGSSLIIIPSIRLPQGWSHPETIVKFLVPVGYPFAKPDCFWTDHQIRLSNNRIPQNSTINVIPGAESDGQHLWFSWHLGRWNPNQDNLSTYVRVIESRLKELR